ncbi:MAG: beta-lactamase family protein [Defluviitaleaceae bacterium]|nr:beta-lactamase family protein [Defluviitaleaceae bacterium]
MDFKRVTGFMESLKDIGVAGADLGVYLKGCEVYRHQVGYADIEAQTPITQNTLFAIWSMTKVVTCVAALRLLEEGRFLLTDPIGDYMPEFREMVYKNEAGEVVPCKRPIRVVDLFTMSTGVSYETDVEWPDVVSDLASFAAAISKVTLHFEPGTRWLYGFSHDILGALIERLTGKKASEYFHDKIFAPLGMDETFFHQYISAENAARLANVYKYDAETRTHTKDNHANWDFENCGGGLVSSVADYAKFTNALCNRGTAANGYRLLSKTTIELMRTNHLCETRMKDYWQAGYGYGLGVRTHVDKAQSGMNANIGEYGWAGYLGTYFAIDPVAELTYVYAHQLSPSLEGHIAPRLKNIIYSCL